MGTNTNEPFGNQTHECNSHAIIIFKPHCPTLTNKINTAQNDPYRRILNDVASYANSHICTKKTRLKAKKNKTSYIVPPDYDETLKQHKQKIGDVIVLDDAIEFVKSISGVFDSDCYNHHRHLITKYFDDQHLHESLTEHFGYPEKPDCA